MTKRTPLFVSCLCSVYFAVVGQFGVTLAESSPTEDPLRVLNGTKAMVSPDVETGLTDPIRRKAAKSLFSRQMVALRQLAAKSDPSLIPLLIPYIYYTDEPSIIIGGGRPTPPPSLESWAFHWPALAMIEKYPFQASPELAKFILNTKNELGFRMHAFEALVRQAKPGFSTELKSEQHDK